LKTDYTSDEIHKKQKQDILPLVCLFVSLITFTLLGSTHLNSTQLSDDEYLYSHPITTYFNIQHTI